MEVKYGAKRKLCGNFTKYREFHGENNVWSTAQR